MMNYKLGILGQGWMAVTSAALSLPHWSCYSENMPISFLPQGFAFASPLSGMFFPDTSWLHPSFPSHLCSHAASSGRSLLTAISEVILLSLPHPLFSCLYPHLHSSSHDWMVSFTLLVDLFIVFLLHENIYSMRSEFFFTLFSSGT